MARTTIERRHNVLCRLALQIDALTSATREDIEVFLDSCRLGARSRYTYISQIAAFYDWAVDYGHIEANPAADLPRPRLPQLLPRPLAEDDYRHAIKAAGPRMRAWLTLGAYMGLRCKEIAGLRAEDLLLERDPALLVVSQGKGGRERILPLNAEVLSALRCHGIPPRGYLFTIKDRPLKPATVSVYISKYLRGLGIRGSAHQLRHLFGTKLYAMTKDIALVQNMMGHCDSRTTSVYVAFSFADGVAAMQSMDY